MEIKKSIIGRENDIYEYMAHESQDKKAFYNLREGYWNTFIDNEIFRSLDSDEKFLNLIEDFEEISLDQIPKFLGKIKRRSNLLTLIELCETNNRSFFIFGFGKVIKIFSGCPTKNEEEMITDKFLSYSFKFLFEAKLNDSILVRKEGI